MTADTPRIALISAVVAAIAPATAALSAAVPSAELWNLLDDRLLSDADRVGAVDARLEDRMRRLISHAITEGADAVLLTCSLYGPVAQGVPADVPVLAPDEAAFARIATAGWDDVLVVASFDGAREDSVERLSAALAEAGSATRLTATTSHAAMDATKRGDTAALETALAATIAEVELPFDAVFLAQYSLAPAAEKLAATIARPVVTGPASAADAIRAALGR